MVMDPKLSEALKNTRGGLPTIVSNIQARPDYAKRPQLAEVIQILNTYNLNLLTAEARETLSQDEKNSLIDESAKTVQPALASLMNANLVMSKMGQLNLNRTISPTMALNNNKAMEAEQGSIDELIAQLLVPAEPPVKEAVLKSLAVSGGEKTTSGLYYQFYSEDQSVRILAVTEPNTEDAWTAISWTGGEDDFSGANNLRAVPLNKLTTPGSPTTVTATVNGKSLSVQVAVVPNLMSLEVTGALNEGGGKWSVAGEGPVTVCAATSPETSAAYPFISWTGGQADTGKGNNYRLVDFSSSSSTSAGLPVSAAIKIS